MRKLGRNYRLTVQANDGSTLEIKPPFSLQFDIIRNVLSSANTCTFQIFNLSPNHRKLLQKNSNDFGNIRALYFQAGYGDDLSLCFSGNISQGYSVRQGTDYITSLEAFDGGFAFINSRTNLQIPAGTPRTNMVKSLVQQLPGVTLGAVGAQIQGTLPRSNSFKGSTTGILDELAGGSFFIDNGKAYILSDNECLAPAGVQTITAATGLLNTPIREQTKMSVEMVFEPKLRIAQLISLESRETYLNGRYKVVSLHHHGMISESVAGDAITEAGLLAPFAGIELTVIPEVA